MQEKILKRIVVSLLIGTMVFQNGAITTYASTDGMIIKQDVLENESESESNKIPEGAGIYNGHHYYVYDFSEYTWTDAKAYCESLGGYLATITSKEENDYVYQYVIDSGYSSAYFGLADEETEGIWEWVTGEAVTYTNWASGEPNKENSNENYAMFYYKYTDGKWNDGDFGVSTLGKARTFICEWGDCGQTEDERALFNGNAYKAFHIGGYTWEQAKTYCEKQGGHLATVTSQEEEEVIESLLMDNKEFYWLGGKGAVFGGEWSWVTGESFSYTNWDPKQPDNDGGECYLGITAMDTRYADVHKWNDYKNDGGAESSLADSGFICEWEDYSVNGSLQIDVPKDKFAVIVRNKAGKGIVGAEVQYGYDSYTSEADGVALLPLDGYSISKTLTVSADRYITRTLPLTQNLNTRQALVVLNDNTKQVNYAKLENQSICIDVLSKEYRLDVGDDSTEYRLEVALGDSSIQVAEYTLVLNGSDKKLKSAEGNVFTFKGSDLQGWLGTLAVCVYGKDGMLISKTPLALKTYKASTVDEPSFEISGGKITIQVDKDAPIMANKKLTFDLGSFPVEFYKSESKWRIGVNLDASTLRDKNKWLGLKDIFRANSVDKFRDNVDKYIKKKEQKSDNLECNVIGYAECDYSETKATFNILIKLSWKLSSGEQQVSFFVVKVTGKIEGSASTSLGIQWENAVAKPYWSGLTIKPGGSVEVSAGVGAANVVSASIYGKAGTEMTFNLFSAELPLVSSWKVNGEVGVVGRVLWHEVKLPLWEGEKYLYYSSNKKKSRAVVQKIETTTEKLQDTSLYQDASRSYLARTSAWNTGRKARALTENGVIELQNNIYTDVRSLMVNTSDGLMMLYTADGGSDRADRDRTMLVYSLYDSERGKWGEPEAVSDDKTADFSPAVWSDGEKAYVVWQNATGVISETESMEEVAKNLTLCAGIYENGTWSVHTVEPTVEDGAFERMPQIYSEDGMVHVAWVQSEEDPVFGSEGGNTICEYRLNQNAWEEERNSLIDGSVLNLEIGNWGDNRNCILYTEDIDKDLTTKEDIRLVVLKQGTTDEFYIRKSGVQQASFAKQNGDEGILYYQDGKLYFQKSQDMSLDEPNMAEILTPDDVDIPENYELIMAENDIEGIVWTSASENRANIYGIFCDEENQWSEPVLLTEVGENEYLENVAVQNVEGEKILVCTRRYFEWSDILDGGDGKEANALCYMYIRNTPDLEVSYAELDQSSMEPGTMRDMEIAIENGGTEEVSAFQVTVTDKEGNIYYNQNVRQKILAGSKENITIQIPIWEEMEQKELAVSISCDNEKNTENNTYTLLAGQANLEVYADKYLTDGRYTLGVTVTNYGFSPVSGTVYIADYETGTIYKTIDTKELAYQQSDIYLIEMGELGLDTNENTPLYIYTETEAEQVHVRSEEYTTLFAEEKQLISDLEGLSVTLSQNVYTYDGTEKKPEVMVNGLREGIDYKVSYINNVNAGTAAAIVTGINDYCGSLSQDFVIERMKETITGTTQYSKHLKSEPFLLDAVTEGDGILSYSSSDTSVVKVDEAGKVTVKGVGEAIITVKGEETLNYIPTELHVLIVVSEKAPDISISTCNVLLEQTNYVYDKNEKKPSVTVTDGDILLQNGVHYTASYENNTKAGTAKVIVTAIEGSGYSGSAEKTFTIQKATRTIRLNGEAAGGYVRRVGDSYFYPSVTISPYYTPTWTSSNPKVVEVTKTGLATKVLIKGAGTAILTVTVPETENYLSCSQNIPVTITGRQNQSTAAKSKPKKTKITFARKKGRKLTVKWKKVSGVDGYQLQYFAGVRGKKRTVNIYRAKAFKKVIKELNSSKRYYVRIRTFKWVGITKKYSAWSKKKKVR